MTTNLCSMLTKLSTFINTTIRHNVFANHRCGIQTSAAVFKRPENYTMKLLPKIKNGGRSYITGRIVKRRVGGGHKQRYRMIDYTKDMPKDGTPVVEKVMQILYDPNRTAHVAVVATGNRKRFIIAAENIKPGDLIESTGHIPDIPLRAVEGNSHAVGALPIGTIVHNIEMRAGEGGKIARAAGSCGIILKQLGQRSVIKMPSKREMNISQECMATVGKVSNSGHSDIPIGSASRSRWLGIRPKSGLCQKKMGYHGRNIKAPPKPVVYNARTSAPDYQIFRESS